MMKLHIKDNKKIKDIKGEFTDQFPFLKIEFFKHRQIKGVGSPKSDMITDNLKLGAIRKKHNEGDLIVTDDMKVGSLEREFETKYDIHIQVFRKSKDLWLETSATDHWTLAEQNKTGAEMSVDVES